MSFLLCCAFFISCSFSSPSFYHYLQWKPIWDCIIFFRYQDNSLSLSILPPSPFLFNLSLPICLKHILMISFTLVTNLHLTELDKDKSLIFPIAPTWIYVKWIQRISRWLTAWQLSIPLYFSFFLLFCVSIFIYLCLSLFMYSSLFQFISQSLSLSTRYCSYYFFFN